MEAGMHSTLTLSRFHSLSLNPYLYIFTIHVYLILSQLSVMVPGYDADCL